MLPPEHKGFADKRTWYKVKWIKNLPHGKLEGKTDLVREEDFDGIKDFVVVLESVRTAKCVAGIRLGYGKTAEKKIDEWITKNAER